MTNVNETKKKSFWFFDGYDFFEFLRRTMSLISPSVMVVLMFSLGAFFTEDKFGNNSYQYKTLIGSIVFFIVLVVIAILYDLHKGNSDFNLGYICKLFIFAITIILCGAIIYIGVVNGANMYSLINSWRLKGN
ncbi:MULTISPECIES: hypothetical protein [Proteus]|uniref:Uncharacterized protein n=5 Tax=Proteus TaxID=583 RepID=A0AAJ0Y823_PROMI|nr:MULTISPECIES: hypothetical protein [Proteus]ARA21110.1 hypothetical protein AM438_00840 [Proteus mirabilis]ARX35903.1 hypothetical protein AM402_17800 [Proteus mirabilis]EJD6314802.1 hypothetical protein [Proteus mirabilis]EJD6318912.1 hypothetical protein [Proteus mirabilis]EJD6438228.1 hypothetical protein [Proteus mirabilis]